MIQIVKGKDKSIAQYFVSAYLVCCIRKFSVGERYKILVTGKAKFQGD